MILFRIMSLVFDGIPRDCSIKTLNLRYHYPDVLEPIHKLLSFVLPGVVPPS